MVESRRRDTTGREVSVDRRVVEVTALKDVHKGEPQRVYPKDVARGFHQMIPPKDVTKGFRRSMAPKDVPK